MKYDVEMAVGFCASVVVEANDSEEAIKKARKLVDNHPEEYADDAEIECINYVSEPH